MSKTKIVNFKDLSRWDVGYFFNNLFNSKYKFIKFKDFLIQIEPDWEILDENKSYKILGVRTYGIGVFHNRLAKGKELITKTTKRYQKIQTGNLFWCKVDTKNGAFGVVTDEYNNYYASHNMTQVHIDKNVIHPLYLQYLFSVDSFQKFLDSQVAGTTNRRYISLKQLLEIEIPLPPLEIQKEIITKLQTIKNKIKELQLEEEKIKKDIEAYIYVALGLKKPKDMVREKIFTVSFKNLSRWDITHNQGSDDMLNSNKYKTIKLSNICEINPKTTINNNQLASFIPMEKVQTDGKTFTFDNKNTNESKGYTKFQNNDILWAKISPCMQNKKSVLVKKLTNGVGFGSTEFFIIRAKTSKINMNFILAFLRLDYIIQQAQLSFKGSAGQQRVPKQFLENLKIPLPPIEIQNKIVKELEQKYEKIEENKQKAKKLEQDLYLEIENIIIGE